MIIIKKMVYIALLTAILFALKIAFGFIAGVEFVTALILLYALFFLYSWTIIITIAFNILVGVFYGFGPWWIVYWFIWPTEVTLTYLFRRIIGKNNILFSFWALFWGFSILLWYIPSNYLIGGEALVIASFLSGFIFNLIEGLCNFIFGIIIFYPFKNIVNHFIKNNYSFEFKKGKI